MIFSEEFDSALCLILINDKKNRKAILEFICSIPEDFRNQINLGLKKYYEYELKGVDILDREDFCLIGELLVVDNCKYSFVIDMMLHSLTITKSVLHDKEFSKSFELSMYACTSLNNVDIFGNQVLGHLEKFDDSMKLDYNLVDTMFGRMFNVSGTVLKKYRRIPLKRTSKDIDINNMNITNGYSRVKRMH